MIVFSFLLKASNRTNKKNVRPPIKGGAKSHNSPPSPEFSGRLALEERAKDVMTESRIPIRNFSVLSSINFSASAGAFLS